MRKLIVAAFVSLDGVMQAPGGPDEDTSGGFKFGGWIVPYTDPTVRKVIDESFAQPFELLLGRRTYDLFASYWPNAPAGDNIGDKFNAATKHVVTHRDDALRWRNSHAVRGELADAIRALKQQDGATLLTQGSSELVQQLLAAGLVDELHLRVFPVVLGKGKRLFGDDAQPAAFVLAESITAASGVLLTRHVRKGEIRTGSF